MKKVISVIGILTMTLGLVGILTITSTAPVVAVNVVNSASNVCPGGDGSIDFDGWIKIEGTSPSYTADEGFIIVAVCVKGGNENSPNNYKHTFTSDGWFQIKGENCVEASGIGTNSASATRNPDITGSVCANISHGSFKIGEEQPTQVPTEPTQVPTEPTQVPTEPTQVPTEPTQVPTEPTQVPTEPTQVPTEPTQVPTEPTQVPTEPTQVPTEPTQVPTEPTQVPTEEEEEESVSVETDPELGASNLPLILGGSIVLLGTGSFFLLKKKK